MTTRDIISFQLYSLRNYHGLEEQLALLSDIGYRQVETTRRNYADPVFTRHLLDEHGMRSPTGHFMIDDLRSRLDWAIEVARGIGIDQLVIPGPFEAEKSWDAGRWRSMGREMGEIAARLNAQGMRLAFHNHDGEFALMPDGMAALDHLFAGAGHDPLYWQCDLGWLARARVDPIEWLSRHHGRVISAHIKDVAPLGEALEEDGWADVGYGTLDWRRLWPAARAAGAEWMIVEHDEPNHPEASPRRSFEFLQALEGLTR